VSVKHLDLAHNQISSWATDPETDGNCYGFQESSSGLCGTPEPRHRVNSLSFLNLSCLFLTFLLTSTVFSGSEPHFYYGFDPDPKAMKETKTTQIFFI
jgi:hypothetical protein